MTDFSSAVIAFGVAMAAAPIVLWILRRTQMLDLPTERSSHRSATPRGGGVAPALACVLAGTLSTELSGPSRDAILTVAVCLGLIGLADDVRPRRALARLAGQVIVAMVSLIWLVPGFGHDPLVSTAVATGIVAGMVGYVNAFNFMDGINGLAVAQVIVAGVSWCIIGWSTHVSFVAEAGLLPAAAVLGFAPFNVPRAKMFLGDVGSYFLGGWLGVTAIVAVRAGIALEAVLAPLTVFLADTGVTLVQRVRRGDRWSQPHRDHVYQRLVKSGWSHTHTTLWAGSAMVLTSALGALSLTGMLALRLVGDTLVPIVLTFYLMTPTIVSRPVVPGSGETMNPDSAAR